MGNASVVEWSITTDCKSVAFGLRRFESYPAHNQNTPVSQGVFLHPVWGLELDSSFLLFCCIKWYILGMKFNALESIQRKPDEFEPNSLLEKEQEKSSREILNIEIEGKNYEVIKTHFTYPEHIIKENGGVEGYDRFQLSWESLELTEEEEEKINLSIEEYKKSDEYKNSPKMIKEGLKHKGVFILNKISDKLGIGTEMQNETIGHSISAQNDEVNATFDADSFLTKPFDIHDFFEHYLKTGKNYFGNAIRWKIFSNGDEVNINQYLENQDPRFSKSHTEDKNVIKATTDFKYVNIPDLLNFLKDKDIICPNMSFTQGSHLSQTSGSILFKYKNPFLNFNNRNSAFKKYIENIKLYKEKYNLGEIQTDLTNDVNFNHPLLTTIFTKEFPSFNWSMADTAYIPMKEGPNFFKFYSRENEDVATETKE